MVTIAEDYRRKHLTILKNLYSGDKTLIEMANRAQAQFDVGEGDLFAQFAIDVGNMFIELKEELDQGLEDLGDIFSDPNPRLWEEDDFAAFYVGIHGHKFEDIYLKMVKGQDNINLVWKELENRLDLP